MSSSYRNWLVRAAVAAALATGASAAYADAWIFDPRVEVGAVYDDNYRLSSIDAQKIDVTGAAVDAELGMRTESPRSLFGITPRVHSTFFPDASSEEATDYYLAGTAQTRTQRLVSKFDAQFADESVVSSELLSADFPGVGLGQPVSGDTGRVSIRNRRRLVTATPSVSYDWTERRHLTADLQYVDAKFDNNVFEQVGYTSYGATAGILFNTTQRSTVWLQLLGSRFSADNNTPDTDTTGVAVEYRTSSSEITSFYARIGAAHSQRDAQGINPSVSTTSFNGGVGAEWRLPTTRFVLDALRSTSPSSAGAVVNRDEVRFRTTHDFTPRFSASLAARGIKTTGLQNSVSSVAERKYATGTAGFEWRANRQISLEGAYDYRWQKYQTDPSDAVSNAVTLSVVYQPRRLAE
jgi:hypothetical protein